MLKVHLSSIQSAIKFSLRFTVCRNTRMLRGKKANLNGFHVSDKVLELPFIVKSQRIALLDSDINTIKMIL